MPRKTSWPEMQQFEKALRSKRSGFADLFGPGPVTLGRAPARLDVMGGIADYSGAHVCQYPLACATVVGVQKRRDRKIRAASLGVEEHGLANDFECSLDELLGGGASLDYARAREFLLADASRSWAAYIVGALATLLIEGKIEPPKTGLSIGAMTSVPMNVGVASSAAAETAALYALDQALGLGLDGVELARLGQLVENRVVGAPCGIMDQLVSALGEQDKFLHIVCQPYAVEGTVEAPVFCEFAGINSMVKHSVGGDKYTDTRVATFMGRRIIFERIRKGGSLHGGEEPFGGYLANIAPEDYTALYRSWLPARMTGAAFLAEYETTDDPVAQVKPEKEYAVESRASHPIYESWRVRQFLDRLYNARITGERGFAVEAGKLMYASHWSYATKCGMSCPEVDFLVSRARALGPEEGVYGAKITGGGCGGTVAVMGERGKLSAAIERIVAEYRAEYGVEANVLVGSSPGAYAHGPVTMKGG